MLNALLKFCDFFFFLSFLSNERRGRGVTSGDRDTKSQQTKQLVQIYANCLVGVRNAGK